MGLKARLDRLERHAPAPGPHDLVLTVEERQDATVHLSRCSCGQEICLRHPTLMIVLEREPGPRQERAL
jgi:hypothetical protein